MIKYNGVELTEIAPVKIDDIVVSPIELKPLARNRAVEWGSEFVRMNGGTRTITITFALLEMDRTERENSLQAIRDWAVVSGETTLELPHFSTRHLECVCTQYPEPSYRKWFEARLRLVFTCYNNPYWTSNELVEVPCGQTFSIGGSATPLITIERNGLTPVTNQTFSNGTEIMQFTTIPAGNFKLDLNRQTAQIGNTSIMRYYVPTSTWITPKTGAYQTITGVGTIKYRERWV